MVNFTNNSNFNYIEIVLVKKRINPFVYDIDFTENECGAVIMNVLEKFQKSFFKKHTTKHVYNTLELSKCNAENVTTLHNVILVDTSVFEEKGNTYLINYYDKNMLPNHSFPSTTSINEVVDSKRLSMKIMNNVYINVDALQYSNGSIHRNVYINVNVKKANDISFINDTVNDIISSLKL
uniref:Uncharacterized protein n=1 Tax=Pyramimonas orientalis virus TaxID=455367 RepID=A0A7M3UNX9_POV01|nr:hypothetical protein HWQ62_00288 [Pyramimonas orientalis virus]